MDTAEHDKYTHEEGKSKVHKMHAKPETNPVNVTRALCTYTHVHIQHVCTAHTRSLISKHLFIAPKEGHNERLRDPSLDPESLQAYVSQAVTVLPKKN